MHAGNHLVTLCTPGQLQLTSKNKFGAAKLFVLQALSCKSSIAIVTGAASTAVSTCMVKTAGSWMSCCCLDRLLRLQWELEVGIGTTPSAVVSFGAASAFCRTTDKSLDYASVLSHSL